MSATAGGVSEGGTGFVLTRDFSGGATGLRLEFWLAGTGAARRVCIDDQLAVGFVARRHEQMLPSVLGRRGWSVASTALRSFDGAPVSAVYCADFSRLQRARDALAVHDVPLFETDIRPPDRYLMERFIRGGARVDAQGRALTAAVVEPRFRALSFDIETSVSSGRLLSVAVVMADFQRVFLLESPARATGSEVVVCADEATVIGRFLDCVERLDPDLLLGWNVVDFDLAFLDARCRALGIPFTIGRQRGVPAWRSFGNRRRVRIPGRVALDGIELLRTATWHFESFALEAVSRELLGRGKRIDDVEQRATEIERLHACDPDALAAYNLEDCRLVVDIFAVANLIPFAIERACLTGLELDRAAGAVAAFDHLYLPRLHRAGLVAPQFNASVAQPSPGGHVLASRPGLYDDVALLDFKSLYPSIIRTFNVDPLALQVGLGEADAIEGYRGARFSRHQAILPDLLADLWEARDEARGAGNEPLSRAIKILMNSFYGVLGTTACRFFDHRLASSITLRGHDIIRGTRDLIESLGLPVIYGDTDSVFVWFGGAEDEVWRDGAVSARADRLAERVNDHWREALRRSHAVESRLEVQFERHFRRFFMPTMRGTEVGSKKRYAGLAAGGGSGDGDELVVRGLEAVRSDWSPLARSFQRELYGRIFRDQPWREYVNEVVAAVRRGERDSDLVLRKRLRRDLQDYRRQQPPHVQAARQLDALRRQRGLPGVRRGDWIEYVITVAGAEPVRHAMAPLDYEFYVGRQLAPVADTVLQVLGTSLQAEVDRQLTLFDVSLRR